jgi:hypothetical protein
MHKGGHVRAEERKSVSLFLLRRNSNFGLQRRSLRFKFLGATFNCKFYFSNLFFFPVCNYKRVFATFMTAVGTVINL